MTVRSHRYPRLMKMLLAIKDWDIDNAFTHPDDFIPKTINNGGGHAAYIGTLERMSLVESEIDCNEKWYRLTEDGRYAIDQFSNGVSLADIFGPIQMKKCNRGRPCKVAV